MIYRFDAWELDESAGELRRGGLAVPIQPKPLALLTLLIEERHRIVPNDELLERLWPDETVTTGSLTRAVSVARSAIGDSGRSGRIRSYTRRGYRFHGEVVELDDEAGAAPGSRGDAAPDPEMADGRMPFVGRDRALARLRAAWNRTLKGLDGIVVVSGPAGIGKTRLTEVFEREVTRRGGLALRGRALEEEGEPPFWVWAQVLRRLHREDPEILREPGLADSGELLALMPELAASEPGATADLPVGQRRFVLFDAVARVLRRAAGRRPLLVVFEDLHWADPASLRLLEYLAFELSGAPVLLLATVRDGPPVPNDPSIRTLAVLRRRDRCATVTLERLAAGEVERLVCQLVGRPHHELARRLRARTDGVPLFLREACRRLLDPGAPADPASLEEELPLAQVDWVKDALAGLSPRCAALLAAAAVVGRDFPLTLVAAAAQVSRDEALDLLDGAVGAGVVEADPDAPVRYRFVHDLFRESCYAGLAPGARARVHQRIADQLERQHGGELDRVIAELAHHRHRALAVGDPAQAFACARRAARRAFELCAYERSTLHGVQALAALDQLEGSDPELRLATLLELGEASRLSDEPERRRHYLGEALALARKLDRPEQLAAAAIGLCDLTEWGIRDNVARAALEEATLRLAKPEPELEAKLLTRLGYLDAMFDRAAAEQRLRRAVSTARTLGASDALEEALYALHLVLGGPDGQAERREILSELRGAASAARDPVASVIAMLDVACDRLEAGDAAGAALLRREADSTAGRPPHPRTTWHRQVYDTGLALLEGRLDEVEGRLEEATALGHRIRHPYARGCSIGQQAGLHAVRGEPAEVMALMEPALRANQGPVHWVKLVAARAQAALGRRDAATMLYEQSLEAGPEGIPRNLRWMSTLVELAHCCADLSDEDRAGPLCELLRPYEGRHGVMPMVVCYGGPVSFALARLHELRSRVDDADALYAEALSAAEGVGAKPCQAQIRLAYGGLLRRRGRRREAREQLTAAAALAADLGLPSVERQACEQLER